MVLYVAVLEGLEGLEGLEVVGLGGGCFVGSGRRVRLCSWRCTREFSRLTGMRKRRK